MVLISLSFSLLALVAGMYLLAKTRKESLGKFFGFVSWLVICVSLLAMLCSLSRGAMHMRGGYYMERSMEYCHPGMGMMDEDCCMPMRGHHQGMMDEEYCGGMMGKGKMKGKCCEMEEEDVDDGGGEMQMHHEKDTLKK